MANKVNVNINPSASMAAPITGAEIFSIPDKLKINIQEQSTLSNYQNVNLDYYVKQTVESGGGDDASANHQTKVNEIIKKEVFSDDSLIPLINYTDPHIKHDPSFVMEPIVLPYTPEEAHDINEKGEINTYEPWDHTKVDAVLYPVVEVSNKVLTREHLVRFCLSYTEFAPSLYLVIRDIGDFAKRSDIFGMNSEIKVVIIPPVNNSYRPIRLLFQISDATFDNDLIYITGTYKLCSLKEALIRDVTFPECKKCNHPKNNIVTTWELVHEVAARTGLGFSCTEKCEDINDRNQRILSKTNYFTFLQEEIEKGGLDEYSLFDAWIDLYNYIVLVNLPYIFNSDITYRHLSIRAVTGFHSTAVRVPTETTERIKTVHRILTNFKFAGEPNNLQIASMDVMVSNSSVENGNLEHIMTYTPMGVGEERTYNDVKLDYNDETKKYDVSKYVQNTKDVTGKVKEGKNNIQQIDTINIQNAYDAKIVTDYLQTKISNLQVIRDMTNTKLQRKLRSAFLSKHRQRVYRVRLLKMNLDIQRGTLVEVRWYETTPDAKYQAQHSPDNVVNQQSADPEPIRYDSMTDREAIEDGTMPVLNFGNSGQFYVDGMEFQYHYDENGETEIQQFLFLIKKGLTSNLSNKYTAPRTDDEAFLPKPKITVSDPDVVIEAKVEFSPNQ